MKFGTLIRVAFCFLGSQFAWSMANAETPFIADVLIYDSNTEEIIANGDVEINADQGYFYLDKLIYDIETGSIRVEGNVRGVLPSGERIMSDYAFIDQETKELILKNAHILLDSELQIVASRVKETEEKTYAENITLTSCEVCVINPVPIWQIKADQVIRDKQQSKIYFNNAQFEIFGLPVIYLPKMRIPDGGVTRMSGFLRPELVISDLYDSGLRLHYFHAIDDNSDILLSNYFTSSGVFNIEGRYRSYVRGGKIQLDGAYSLSDGDNEYGQYYLQSRFTGNLTKNISLDTMYTINSNNDFAPNFSYNNARTNYLTLSRTNNNHDVSLSIIDYRATSIAREDYNNPFVIPRLQYRSNQQVGVGTALFSDFDVLGLVNEDDDDVMRFAASIGVDDVYALPFGVSVKSQLGGRAQLYVLGEYGENDFEMASRVAPSISIDATLPMARMEKNGASLFIPRAQFIWSENYESGADIPNSDALFIEHDYITLFSNNQYSGQDRLESGFRLNLGASYVYTSNLGSNFDFGFGKVIRISPDDTLLEFTDSNAKDAEWVGYINFVSADDYSIYARGSWDNEFAISRAEIGFDWTQEDYSFAVEAVHLEPEPEIGYDDVRQEATVEGFYHFAPNWQADFGLQYDLVNTYPVEGSIELTYGNECIEASAGFVQDFNRGEGIDDETTFEFSISFIGLGQTPTRDWPRRECSSISQLN